MSKGIPTYRKAIYAVFFTIVALILGFGFYLSEQKPDLPIVVKYRESMLGKGYVVQFHNKSEKHLKLKVKFSNSTTGQIKEDVIDLKPKNFDEIGWAEGWQFASGEYINVYHADYRSGKYQIP